jgi:hypothetical protein
MIQRHTEELTRTVPVGGRTITVTCRVSVVVGSGTGSRAGAPAAGGGGVWGHAEMVPVAVEVEGRRIDVPR